MAAPWFDYTTYMASKLAQMQYSDPTYTAAKLKADFEAAGFVGEEGAYQHFTQYGVKEAVSPNPFFNVLEYYEAKAAEFYKKPVGSVTKDDVAAIKKAIDDAGMSAWEHYTKFGSTEGINPSNGFDGDKYMAAKLAALNATITDETKKWTPETLKKAFADAGLSALEHFALYGGSGEGEVVEKYSPTSVDPKFQVDADKKVPVIPEGDTFVLSSTVTIAQLTAKGDYVDAVTNVNSIDKATVLDSTTTDKDVINVAINQDAAPANVLNVENINVDYRGFGLTFDASNVMYGSATGETNITVSTSTAGNSTVGVKGLSNKNVNVTVGSGVKTLNLDGTTGTSDTTKVYLNGTNLALNNIGDGIENITFVGKGAASTVTLDNNSQAGKGVSYIAAGDQDVTLKTTTANASGVNFKKDAGYGNKFVLELSDSASGAMLNNAAGLDQIKLSGNMATPGTGTFANNANISINHVSALSGAVLTIGTPDGGSAVTKGALNLSVDKANAVANQTITLDYNVATLNLTANQVFGSSTQKGTLTFDDTDHSGVADNRVLNIAGEKDVFIAVTGKGAGSGAAITPDTITINAGSMGGKLNLDATTNKSGADIFNIIGSKQGDTIKLDALNTDATGTSKNTSTINAGDGNDNITLSGLAAGHNVIIMGEGGTDTFTLTGSLSGKVSAFGGDGDDTFNLNTAAASSSIELEGGAGNNVFNLLGTQSGILKVTGGADSDTFTFGAGFSGAAGSTISVDGGAGDDLFVLTATASGASAGLVKLTGGAGVDTYKVDYASGGSGFSVQDFNTAEDKLVLTGGASGAANVDVTVDLTSITAGAVAGNKLVLNSDGKAITGSAASFASLGTADAYFKIDGAAGTGVAKVTGGNGADFVDASAFAGSGDSTSSVYALGKGADKLKLSTTSAVTEIVKIGLGDSAIGASDEIFNFNVTNDKIQLKGYASSASVHSASFDLGSIAFGGGTNGVFTVSGSTNIDDIAKALSEYTTLDGKFLAFSIQGSSDTYIFQGDAVASNENLVKLTGTAVSDLTAILAAFA